MDSYRGGAGAPLKTESGTLKTRMAITMKRGDYGGKENTFMNSPLFHKISFISLKIARLCTIN